jgi:hypothetical protein
VTTFRSFTVPRLRCAGLSLALAAAALPSLARGGAYASGVVSYTPGGADARFTSAQAALGAPDGISGENPAAANYFGASNVLSPFSPAFQSDEVVQIGEGGQITLQLSNYLNVGAGNRLGVISNVGLIDSNYPNGQNSATAASFGGGSAQVRVSADKNTWTDLGTVNFNIPGLYYVNAGPFDGAAPASPQLTDFGKPFEGSLASFNGKDYAGTVNAFKVAAGGYSGGGTWLDLSGSGLSQVGYVQFIVADDGNVNTNTRFALDSVSIANNAVGAALPEPGCGLLMITVPAVLLRRRRKV